MSIRSNGHTWNPRAQCPELWRLFNFRLSPGETARVFSPSNWTESDIWTYVAQHDAPLAPLYFAAPSKVVERSGALSVVDDVDRMRFRDGEQPREETVRFRTLGCWSVTGAVRSTAIDLTSLVQETLGARTCERQGRVSDGEAGRSLEQKKANGYF